MARWTCTDCGCAEELSFYPDCCSYCRGGMETQDGRHTASANIVDDDAYFERMETVWDEEAAEQGDAASIIRLWQRGRALPAHQQSLLDDIRLSNSIATLSAVFGDVAA